MVAPSKPTPKHTRVRISKSGQVTIPAHIRAKLGVTLGEHVDFVEGPDGTVMVKPARILSVEEISGKFGRPVDPQELREALREARQIGAVRQRYRDGSIVNDLD